MSTSTRVSLEAVLRGLRTSTRTLARQATLSVIVIVTLALGIGGATALFSVANGVLLRPLPVRDQDRVLVGWRRDLSRQLDQQPMNEDVILTFGRQSRSFSEVGAMIGEPLRMPMRIGEEILYGDGGVVSGNFFQLLGAQPLMGRTLRPADDVFGAEPVAVLGQGMWERMYGSDPQVVGKLIRFGGVERTIVGVMPRSFSLPHGAEFWAPITLFQNDPAERPQFPFLALVGRLAPDVDASGAESEFAAYLRDRSAELPQQLPNPGAHVMPIAETVVGDVRPVILALAGASGLLLAIACFNVANLLLMRGVARQREFAVRAALGAGRTRLVWQRMLESLLLGLAGGALGVALAALGMRLLLARAPTDIPRLAEIALDSRALLMAVVVSLVAAIAAGVAPALWAGRTDPGTALRGGGRAVSDSRSVRALKRVFVVGQFALTVIVLAGAGLLANSLLRLTSVPLGFRAEQVTMVPLVISGSTYDTPEKTIPVIDQLVERMRLVPGVVAVAGVVPQPMGAQEGGGGAAYIREGQVRDEADGNPLANVLPVDGAFVQTLDIPIRAGRWISEQDRADTPPVVVVSESFAERVWPGEPPVGQRLAFAGGEGEPEWREVVGVVEDARYLSLTTDRPAIYAPWRQLQAPPLTFLVRSSMDVPALRAALLPAMREVEPELFLPVMRPLPELLNEPLVRPRFYALLLGAFAAGALLLAIVGIYGLMAAAVSERTPELGVRLTLGAMPGDIFRLVLWEGMLLAGAGTLVGLAAALLLTRALGSLLYDITPGDPLTMTGVSLLLLAAGAMACAVPAVRAARTQPAVVLREG